MRSPITRNRQLARLPPISRTMTRSAILPALFLLLAAAVLAPASACDHCGRDCGSFACGACGCECCPCELEEHTVMVPMCVTETHTQVKIVKTMKEREETYTVFERKPVKRKYTKECCYLETEVKSKLISVESCRRVRNPVTLVDTIKVPITTMEEGVRRRKICTECGPVCIEEPCLCTVTRTDDMPRVQNCTREDVVFEVCTKTIDYCVKTPKFPVTECGEETIYELVPVVKTRKVQVCVPEAVKVPCDVKVTRMVAKKICCCHECWCEMQRQSGHKH